MALSAGDGARRALVVDAMALVLIAAINMHDLSLCHTLCRHCMWLGASSPLSLACLVLKLDLGNMKRR